MRKAFHKLIRHLLAEHSQPAQLGVAVVVGIFVGCLPLYGLHFVICLGLSKLLRLNLITVYLAANISNPLFAPALVAAGIVLGEWIRFGRLRPLNLEQGRELIETLSILSGQLPDLFLSCLLGDALLGLALGSVGGTLVWGWARRRAQNKHEPRHHTPGE